MQRYFFNLEFDGEQVVDLDGAKLPDVQAAERDAREAIREISIQHIKIGRPLTLRGINILDKAGHLLAKVSTREALEEIIAPVIAASENPDRHV
jgi:hypothetical protein